MWLCSWLGILCRHFLLSVLVEAMRFTMKILRNENFGDVTRIKNTTAYTYYTCYNIYKQFSLNLSLTSRKPSSIRSFSPTSLSPISNTKS